MCAFLGGLAAGRVFNVIAVSVLFRSGVHRALFDPRTHAIFSLIVVIHRHLT